jgi:hypothetical protein
VGFPPTYREDPLYWEPFWPNLKAALKLGLRKNGLKPNPTMAVGSLLALLVEWKIFVIGSPLAWSQQSGKILVLLALAISWPTLLKLAWQVIAPAFWKVCRRPRFREGTSILLCGLGAVTLWGLYLWHYGYVRSSHFKLTVTGHWTISHITDYQGVNPSFPVASVFLFLTMTNKYSPAFPSNWRMKAAFSNGEYLVGYPANRNSVMPDKMYRAGEFIYSKQLSDTFKPFGGIGNGNTVSAPAEFIFPGVRAETLLSSDAILTVEFEGLNETVKMPLPSHLKEATVLN